MSPARIRTRVTPKGNRRWQVLYRVGGRGSKEIHAGTFSKQKEAKVRRDLVAGELAAGRDPKLALERLKTPAPRRTLKTVADQYLASRVDLAEGTRRNKVAQVARMASLHDLPVEAVGWREIQGWVGEQKLTAETLRGYLSTLRQILDYADIDPNPASDRRLRLPASVQEEVSPPTRKEFHKLLEWLPPKVSLILRLIEATALRVGEACNLQWGDVDVASSRLRISKRRTKAGTGQRWAQVPRPLMDEIEELLSLEDREREAPVFNVKTYTVERRMRTACKLAGVADFTPHDLRHRRLSLWHAQGVPGRVVQDRAGHSQLSTTHDTYTHVVVNPADDDWLTS